MNSFYNWGDFRVCTSSTHNHLASITDRLPLVPLIDPCIACNDSRVAVAVYADILPVCVSHSQRCNTKQNQSTARKGQRRIEHGHHFITQTYHFISPTFDSVLLSVEHSHFCVNTPNLCYVQDVIV